MDNTIIANIKSLGIDMINKAQSGHPGIVLGAAPIIYSLYANHLNISNNDPNWFNRDRFVLSAGHGSALLYATLYMAGYNITIDDLKNFRKIDSKTPGHPEVHITPGVDVSTGPLGQGFATAVGMALASKILKERTTFPDSTKFNQNSLIDFNVYVLCGDGDLMEGITTEAASLAGTWKLNNLIVLYDSNNISLDGTTNHTFTENIRHKMDALGWDTYYVKNGNDLKALNKAINKAKSSSKPAFIEVKTIIGDGSIMANTNKVHGKPLEEKDISQLKGRLGIPNQEFFVFEEARNEFKKRIADRVNFKYSKWATNYQRFEKGQMSPHLERYTWMIGSKQPIDLKKAQFDWEIGSKEATRKTNETIMNVIADNVPNFIGGSADLFSSTNVYIENGGDFGPLNYTGTNIWFGVREHAMGAILNGLALCNFLPYGSTFLSFSDYLKPAIRLSALMKLPVTYIFSHDSIFVGEDGPTHQPIEQLAMLRSIPNLRVFRPCDAHELIGCWNVILNDTSKPNALILSRGEVPLLASTAADNAAMGGYVVKKEENTFDGVIIATGTEVNLAIHIAIELYKNNKIDLRVVSMPCQEIFLNTDTSYQESILPKNKMRIIIEAGSSYSWIKFVNEKTHLITIDEFGYSGSKEAVTKKMGFDHVTIQNKIIEWVSTDKK